jgi:hypothetical protein
VAQAAGPARPALRLLRLVPARSSVRVRSGTVYKGCVEGTSRIMEHVYTRANPPACPTGSFAATWNQVGQQEPPGPPGLSLFARVDNTGVLHQHSAGVTETKDPSFTGLYHVFFPQTSRTALWW